MATLRFTLEYDGSGFDGWQAQRAGTRTVQGELEAALARIAGAPVAVVGAGRTDAGVHAEGQVASARLDTRLAPAQLLRALNAQLPADVAVRAVALAPDDFHARRDARSKLYRYAIWNAAVRSPLRAARSHQLHARLDLAAMRRAAEDLVGEHDFASFQTGASEWQAARPGRSSRRTLSRLEIAGEAGGELSLDVEGSGFLRHMVRALVGTLLDVGRGRRPADSMPALLAARRRSLAGPNAPAHGLTLVRVEYGAESHGKSGAFERTGG